MSPWNMLSRILLITGTFCLLQSQLFGQLGNRPVPDKTVEYEFFQDDTAYHGYYLLTPFFFGGGDRYHTSALLLDEQGYIVWYHQYPGGNLANFRYYPEHDQVIFSKAAFGNANNMVMNESMALIDSFDTPLGFQNDNHEFLILPNGNYLLSGLVDSIVDLSGDSIHGGLGDPNTSIRAYTIHEFDPSHNEIFRWNSNEHIHPTESYEMNYSYNPNNFDYCHGNAIEKTADGITS